MSKLWAQSARLWKFFLNRVGACCPFVRRRHRRRDGRRRRRDGRRRRRNRRRRRRNGRATAMMPQGDARVHAPRKVEPQSIYLVSRLELKSGSF